jgi:hypothetical protein
MASLLMRCGCTLTFDETRTTAPICPAHGNQPVVRVIGMPQAAIRGAAKGPLVERSISRLHRHAQQGLEDNGRPGRHHLHARRGRPGQGPQNLADTGAGGQDLADAFKILSLRLPQTVGPRSLASQRLLTPRTGDTGGLNPHAAVFEALLRATLGGGPAPTLPTVTRGPFQVLPSARTGNRRRHAAAVADGAAAR